MIVIVSLNAAFLSAWRSHLESEGSIFAVSDVAGWQTLCQRFDTRPRLAVIDFDILGLHAISDAENSPAAQLQEWRSLTRGIPLMLAGASFSPAREIAALAAGVAACCEEGLSATEVRKIASNVLGGGVRVSAGTLPALIERLQAVTASTPIAVPAQAAVTTNSLAGLTERQRQVAEQVAEGASNKDIARRLGITERTVKAHLTVIFERLEVADRLQLAVRLNRLRA